MIFSKYNEATKIVEANLEGEISLQDILNYIDMLTEEVINIQTRKIILDASKANLNIKINELKKIAEASSVASLFYASSFIAIIINSPKNTVLSMLYKELILSESVEFAVFSTHHKSIEWLNKF